MNNQHHFTTLSEFTLGLSYEQHKFQPSAPILWLLIRALLSPIIQFDEIKKIFSALSSSEDSINPINPVEMASKIQTNYSKKK